MSWLLNEKNVRFDKMKLIEKGDSTLSHLASNSLLSLIQELRLVVHCEEKKKKKLLTVHLVESKTIRGKKMGERSVYMRREKGGGGMVRPSNFLFGPTKFQPLKNRREKRGKMVNTKYHSALHSFPHCFPQFFFFFFSPLLS